MTRRIFKLALAACLLAPMVSAFADNDMTQPDGSQYTGFSNTGSILNTRHNLTQSTLTPQEGTTVGAGWMQNYRNDYRQVCVYCHTPHGSDTKAAAPLWNRNMIATTYSTYDKLGTSSLTQTVYQPGAASLPCLSCHDGQQAVDAIINMPGAGRYNATPTAEGGSASDLSTRWAGGSGTKSNNHARLAPGTSAQECLSCHSPGTLGANVGNGAVDFTVFAIGTDLRNDHPVGVTFPTETGGGTDWNTPGGEKIVSGLTTKFFDENGNKRLDKTDIRLYDTGNGASVECASCHDPHGVPNGTDGKFNPTFLRKTNIGSAVCLTCHAK